MNRIHATETERSELLSRVQQCILFAYLDAAQIDSVLQHTRIIALDEDEILFEQEQPAHEFFLLEQGQMKLARVSPEGNEKIIDLISPGHSFAEAVMFSRQPAFPVTATAIVNSRVYCFDAKTYTGILHQSTEACFAVMAEMSRRLHGHIAEIDKLTLHNASFRVVCYLLDQVPSTQLGVPEVRLDTPKHVIAARLSITPETLSRSFSRLSREGLIEMHDNAITLNDVGKLRDYIKGG